MKYELFAFDLDGTLLDPSGQLPPTTLDFLNILKAKAHFTLVTGRSLFSARPYIEALKDRDPSSALPWSSYFPSKREEGFI
jgi:hydroxymethylpyrimidine pyrophosphatase-like HAD family hydrolase